MSWEQPVGDSIITLQAEAAINAGAVVTLGTAAGTCKKAGTTDKPIGVAQNAAAAGVNVSVIRAGVARCRADGAFAKGDLLVVADANGEVDTVAALTAGSTAYLIGVALEASNGAASMVPVALGQGISFPQGDLVKIFTAGTGGMTAGCAVKQDSTYGQAVLCTAATDRPIGIALSTVLAAATSAVQIAGICDCKADAAYALGDTLMVADSNGELDTLAGNGALYSVGTAMLVSAGAGVKTNGILVRPQLHQRGYVDVELIAGADLRTNQYAVVMEHTTAGQVVKCTTTGKPLGVLQNTPNTAEVAIVRVAGITSINADAAYALNDLLAVADANGDVDTVGTVIQSPWIVGVALALAGGAGAVVDGMYISICPRNAGAVDVVLLANSNLTAHQYCAVAAHTDAGEVEICAATTGKQAMGILQNAPNTGEPAIVRVAGVSTCLADAAYTCGDVLAVVDGTNGELDTVASLGAGTWAPVVGVAIKGSGGAGAITDGIVIQCWQKYYAA